MYEGYERSRTWFSFELELNASPIFCDVDFSLWGCMLDAAESVLPFSMSPKCSVVDFSESGYKARRQRHHQLLDRWGVLHVPSWQRWPCR